MSNVSRSAWGHIFALVVYGTGFYALVPYPFELSELVKGALIGFMGAALTWEFGSAVAAASARQSEDAAKQGAENALAVPPVSSGGVTTTTTITPE